MTTTPITPGRALFEFENAEYPFLHGTEWELFGDARHLIWENRAALVLRQAKAITERMAQ